VSQSAAEKLLADIAARYNARVRGGKFRAPCPAHKDSSPSLVGSLGCGNREHRNCACPKDRVLLHCFALCSTEAVLKARGLTQADLYVNGARRRLSSPLRAAAAFKPERPQWALDLLASKLPAFAGDLFRDPEIKSIFPRVSAKSLPRSVRRLAEELGVEKLKVGRGRWFWTLKSPQTLEGDKAFPENHQKPQQIAEGDKLPAAPIDPDGHFVPFKTPSKRQETAKGDKPPSVRYEERSPLGRSAFGESVIGANLRIRQQSFLTDSEAQKVVAEVSEVFGRESQAKLFSSGGGCRGCSRCDDARETGLYARVRPGFWLCARCWRSAGGWTRKRVVPMSERTHE
jgi:hypothetical protein